MPARPALGARDVHVWLASLCPSADRIMALEALLSAEEIARANRFRFPADRRRYIVAHGVLRELLGAYLAAPPSAVAFATGEHGKPRLEAAVDHPLHFNLSHSGEYALYGFARCELGVDLEVARENRDLVNLANRYFGPLERAALHSLPVGEQIEAFYRTWTLKEAYVKARGTGLSESFADFEVTVRPGEPARLLRAPGGHADEWSLYDFRPLPAVAGALALRGHGWALGAWLYPYSDRAEED